MTEQNEAKKPTPPTPPGVQKVNDFTRLQQLAAIPNPTPAQQQQLIAQIKKANPPPKGGK